MVRLESGKMKSRDGNAISFDTLMQSLSVYIFYNYLKKYSASGVHPDGLVNDDKEPVGAVSALASLTDITAEVKDLKEPIASSSDKKTWKGGIKSLVWNDDKIRDAIHKISIGIIKYGMLKQDATANIEFSLKVWGKQSGKTGQYLMYTYARIKTMINRVASASDNDCTSTLNPTPTSTVYWNELKMVEEGLILSIMHEFQHAVTHVVQTRNPSTLCDYLHHLSMATNNWIEKMDYLLTEKNVALKTARLKLVESVSVMLRQGLNLLGISTLEEM